MELGQGEPLALLRRRQAIAGELADLLAADPQQLHRPGQPRLVGPEADAVALELGLEGGGIHQAQVAAGHALAQGVELGDRKSTRLNSSHVRISYAVYCLKTKN